MSQILVNSRMCAEGHRPICQDTGIVVVFLKVGMGLRWESAMSVAAMVDEGVHRAYTHPDNILRPSIVAPPIGARRNTGDNTPAVIHTELVAGDRVEVRLAAKGGDVKLANVSGVRVVRIGPKLRVEGFGDGLQRCPVGGAGTLHRQYIAGRRRRGHRKE